MTDNKRHNEDDLEKLMNESASSNVDNKKVLNQKGKKKAFIPVLVSGAVLLAFIGGGYATYSHFHNDNGSNGAKTSQNSTTSSSSSDKEAGGATGEKEVDTEKVINEDAKLVKLEAWQKKVYSSEDDKKEMEKQTQLWTRSSPAANASGFLPSEKDGYTDDKSKAENADGTPNLMYSYQTQENFEQEFGEYINRIINPYFGGWIGIPVGVQGGVESSISDEQFSDMFTKEWWSANIKEGNHRALPLYLDWNGDKYGGLDFKDDQTGVLVGKVTEMTVTGAPNADGTGTEMTVNAKVAFSAKLKDDTVTVKNGTLHLKIVPNQDPDSDNTHRHLISEASLNME